MIFTPAGVNGGSLLADDPQKSGTPGLRAEAIAPQPIRGGGQAILRWGKDRACPGVLKLTVIYAVLVRVCGT